MKVSVLGCGRWGAFIAWYLNRMGHQVFIWGRKGSESLAAIRKKIEAGEEGFSSITAT